MKKFTYMILSNVTITLSLVLLTLFVTDRFNHAMGFMSSEITLWLICAFCVIVIVQDILNLRIWLRESRRKKERAARREGSGADK